MLPLLITAFALALQTPSPVAPTLKYDTPEGWTRNPPASRMRLAEFVLPKAEGDSEDATLMVSYFGGQGGTVQANLDRWISQMSQPDGRASKDLTKTSVMKTHDLTITVLDLPGTFIAEKAPGSTERYNKPGFHLKAAVIEGQSGPYFVRLVGPAKTVARWEVAAQAFFKSLRVE